MQGFIKNKNLEVIYDIFIGFLSVIAVFVVFLNFNKSLSNAQSIFLEKADNIIYIIFLIDGIIKCFLVKDPLKFIRKNKIDYIALIPFQFFITGSFGSIFKLLRVLTYILRILDNMKVFLFSTGFLQLIVFTGFITALGSFTIYFFEKGKGNIECYSDALWLSLVTLTTVGYGDVSPSTAEGKLIAVMLMLSGIGFLSMLTSTISTYIIDLKKNRYNSVKKEEEKVYLDITELDEEKKETLKKFYEFLKNE